MLGRYEADLAHAVVCGPPNAGRANRPAGV